MARHSSRPAEFARSGRYKRERAGRAPQFPVPSYMPPEGLAVIPWARKRVSALAKKAKVDYTDAWDEAMTALLRACVYFKPGAGTFTAYAKVSIERGLWRYALPNKPRRFLMHRLATLSLDDATRDLPVVPSCEEVAIARETARARGTPTSENIPSTESRRRG